MIKKYLLIIFLLCLYGSGANAQFGNSGNSGFSTPGGGSALSTNFLVNWTGEGDSITYGLAGQPSWPFEAALGMPGASFSVIVPTPGDTVITTPISGVGTVVLSNIASSGISTITAAQAYAASRGGVFYNPSASSNVLSIMLGANTSGASDTSGQQKYFWVRNYIRQAQTQGYSRIIVAAMIARDDDGGAGWTNALVPQNTLMSTYYNSDLRADAYIDFAASPLFNSLAAADNTTYYADKVHPTILGESIMGGLSQAIIYSVLQSSGPKVVVPSWSVISADSVNVVLTNSNRTATGTGASVLGFPATTGANKIYFEVSADTVSSFSGVGLANENYGVAGGFVFRSTNAVSYDSDGHFLINNISLGASPTYVSGDLLEYAWDQGTQLIWMRVVHSGSPSSWNSNASANPVTEVGGYDTSTLGAGYIHPAATYNGALTSNFASSQLVGAPPTGYSFGYAP